MNTDRIEQLIQKYEDGQTSLAEEAELREFFRAEEVPRHLASYRALFGYYEQMRSTTPSPEADAFAKIDFDEAFASPEALRGNGWGSLGRTVVWTLRVAAGLIVLLIGFSAGLLVGQDEEPATDIQLAALQQEIQQMKSALVYGAYQQASASERISAVNLSANVPEEAEALSREISEILIYTMNNDQNVNVRQAAAEALFRFRNEPEIRRALVQSLSQQTDPLMQLTLIDMLVDLKERSAINEMQKLLMDSDTREVVKNRLEVSIAELKT